MPWSDGIVKKNLMLFLDDDYAGLCLLAGEPLAFKSSAGGSKDHLSDGAWRGMIPVQRWGWR